MAFPGEPPRLVSASFPVPLVLELSAMTTSTLATLLLAALQLQVPVARPASAAGGASCEPTPITAVPIVIDEPGRYCLTRNLFTDSTVAVAIVINSTSVEIDLNGFSLRGVGETGISSTFEGNSVRNGFLSGFTGIGIALARNSTVQDVSIGTPGSAVSVGARSRVERCRMQTSAGRGLFAGSRSIVRDCVVESAATDHSAMVVGPDSFVQDVTIEGGTVGLGLGERSLAERCIVVDPSQSGIQASRFACVASSRVRVQARTAMGIELGEHGRLQDCGVEGGALGIRAPAHAAVAGATVVGATVGIEAGLGARLVGCSVSGCGQDGVASTAAAVDVRETTATGNGANGIHLAGFGSTLRGCTALANGGDGLVLAGGSVAERNVSAQNGGAGLRVTGVGSRIEQNSLGGNAVGLALQAAQTLVLGNHAVGNGTSDFQVTFPNAVGPILTSPFWIQGSIPQANFATPIPAQAQ